MMKIKKGEEEEEEDSPNTYRMKEEEIKLKDQSNQNLLDNEQDLFKKNYNKSNSNPNSERSNNTKSERSNFLSVFGLYIS